MVNAQQYLDKNYPKEKRKEYNELDLSSKDLEGFLTLDGFTSLRKLNLSSNRLNGTA